MKRITYFGALKFTTGRIALTPAVLANAAASCKGFLGKDTGETRIHDLYLCSLEKW